MNDDRADKQELYYITGQLRKARKNGWLSDEQIARLDAIGFDWNARRRSIDERIARFGELEAMRTRRWHCADTGEDFESVPKIFERYALDGDNQSTLSSAIGHGRAWHGMTFSKLERDVACYSQERSNLIYRLRGDIERGLLSEEQMCALKAAGFPFDSPRNSAWELDARLREIWDEESNGPAVDLHGNTIYHWRCRKCGYEWSRALRLEKISKGCPVCLGRALIPGWTDLQTTHPDLAKEWDQEKNDKLNGGLMPTAVVAGSAKKAWWRCGTCGGEWEAPIVKRSMGKGKCPYCAFRKLRKGVNDLESQYPEVAKDYLPELNGGVPANEVLVSNSSVVRWKCHRCGHEWTGKVTYRTTADPPTGCKPCAERERAAQQRRKAVAESGRFDQANPKLAARWDWERNDGPGPHEVSAKAHKRYWFVCSRCGRGFRTGVATKSTLCPDCKRESGGGASNSAPKPPNAT